MNAALLIIDVQNEFFKNEGSRNLLEQAIPYMNATIDLFRSRRKPVNLRPPYFKMESLVLTGNLWIWFQDHVL